MKTVRDKVTHPAKMSSREFLYEHGYKLAIKGSYNYRQEFESVKAVLSSLSKYATLPELIRDVENDSALCNNIARDLIKLWQDNYQIRPASGAILLFILWKKWCHDVAEIFLLLEKIDVNSHSDIIQELSDKLK